MIYCKAPFDPEAVATTNNYYQGIDYFHDAEYPEYRI